MIEIKPGQVWRKKNNRGPDTVRKVTHLSESLYTPRRVCYYTNGCAWETRSELSSFRRWAKKATLEVEA